VQFALVLLEDESGGGELLQLVQGEFLKEKLGSSHEFLRFVVEGQFVLVNEDDLHEPVDGLLTALLNA
jgi:hypothetical protein